MFQGLCLCHGPWLCLCHLGFGRLIAHTVTKAHCPLQQPSAGGNFLSNGLAYHACDFYWKIDLKWNSLTVEKWSFHVYSGYVICPTNTPVISSTGTLRVHLFGWFSTVGLAMLAGWKEASGIGREAQFGNDVARLHDSHVYPVIPTIFGTVENTEIHVYSIFPSLSFLYGEFP